MFSFISLVLSPVMFSNFQSATVIIFTIPYILAFLFTLKYSVIDVYHTSLLLSLYHLKSQSYIKLSSPRRSPDNRGVKILSERII